MRKRPRAPTHISIKSATPGNTALHWRTGQRKEDYDHYMGVKDECRRDRTPIEGRGGPGGEAALPTLCIPITIPNINNNSH